MQKNQNKFNRNKLINRPDKSNFSENKVFLIELYNKQKTEIEKVNNYLNALNKALKKLESLIDEVK